MKNKVEKIAAAVEHKPHSFDHIRSTTGLKLTDEQFKAIVKQNSSRFKLVRFIRLDDAGKRILPGRPGVRTATGHA
ncbi:MAG: hypothetical protein P4L84_04820 [Isosphaeraceae bacterium]|nr:hypothetical protein [Isosphaeraceae bacterium]